jgi:hypothetical protein
MTTDTELDLSEDALRALFAEAADAAPAPGRAPEDLLAGVVASAGGGDGDRDGDDGDAAVLPFWRRRPSPKVGLLAAVLVLVVAVLGATLTSGDGHGGVHQTAADESAPVTTTIPVFLGGEGGGVGTTGGAGSSRSDIVQEEGAADASGGTNTDAQHVPAFAAPTDAFAPPQPSTPDALTPQDSAKVIKTGSLQLEVRKGSFDSVLGNITAKVTGLRGYVADSTTSSSDSSRSGTITVRVPADSFDQLLGDLRRLGEVKGQTEKGTEVTAQYTDLQARLAAQTATRDRLNVVLSKATNVQDILSVQDRITQVQTQIEQLQGQLRVLDDQTAMGTLAVSVAEPGAKPVVVPNPNDRTIRTALSEARHHFGNGVEAVIAWSGGAAVALLVLLVFGLLAWLAWRARRRWLL